MIEPPLNMIIDFPGVIVRSFDFAHAIHQSMADLFVVVFFAIEEIRSQK